MLPAIRGRLSAVGAGVARRAPPSLRGPMQSLTTPRGGAIAAPLASVVPRQWSRCLCDAGSDRRDKKAWSPESNVHGLPQQPANDGAGPDAAPPTRSKSSSRYSSAQRQHVLTASDKADLLQFQVYVRQRLSEVAARLPRRLGTREAAELAFLEDEVIQDHMNLRRRRVRDPLKDVGVRDIRHTNLPLLSRFVSEAGAILPRKLTGVSPKKQKRLAKAIKRAHHLALMPRTWKLPRYRHASYADQFSQPEEPPRARRDDDEFRDPPDIRFPNQWEQKRGGAFAQDLVKAVRESAGLPPRNPPREGRRR